MVGFKRILFIIGAIFIASSSSAQTTIPSSGTVDPTVLNNYILVEVNQHRKKVKASPLYNDPLLKLAADDHSAYMANKDILTHFQKSKEKKTPKNRVDFYGEQFAVVGENCQQTWMKLDGKHDIKTYEDLAEVLVTGWRNSPPHYANMISEDYTTTYTSVNIGEDGKIYACQLFGSDAYTNSYRDSVLRYVYKPTNDNRCRRCEHKLLVGKLEVVDSVIVYSGYAGLGPFNTKYSKRRLRLNRWRYGLAADIVLKEQYDCDSNIVFNGQTNVRGIPLEPVFKKDFREGSNVFFWKFIYIELGVVPDWVTQQYEVNLTVINNKRTCHSIMYNVLPTNFKVEFNLDLYLDSLSKYYLEKKTDTLIYRINFDKSVAEVSDSLLNPVGNFVIDNLENIHSIYVAGFSSIEGSTETNMKLYNSRAGVITERLIELGIDSVAISISSQENFRDFRKDIFGTQFEYLLSKSDAEIKAEMADKNFSNQLEYILKNHRYAEVKIYADTYIQKSYTKEMVYDLYTQYLLDENSSGCKTMQSVEYNLALDKQISIDEINEFKIPNEKQYIDLLHDRYLMIYRLDTLNPQALTTFKDSLISLQKMDPKDKRINTSLAMLEYEDHFFDRGKAFKNYYKNLISLQDVDPTIKARMILNVAAYRDWRLWFSGRIGNKQHPKFLYDGVKIYIKDAKLNVSETFELATYYAFFEDFHFAFNLTKKIVFRSKSRDEIVFFLKLIYYLDESLSAKTVIKYFRRIAKLRGDEFCTYFNSPDLNFQILDDPEIREIYCAQCSN